VNLARIARHAKPGETILVPGKVLGYGDLSKKIRIAAFSFSSGAAKKIEKSGCKKMKIRDLMKENLKGSEIRIMV
jgi:large subunit ribosomal protein L18e